MITTIIMFVFTILVSVTKQDSVEDQGKAHVYIYIHLNLFFLILLVKGLFDLFVHILFFIFLFSCTEY
jgi:hypothetical protein